MIRRTPFWNKILYLFCTKFYDFWVSSSRNITILKIIRNTFFFFEDAGNDILRQLIEKCISKTRVCHFFL